MLSALEEQPESIMAVLEDLGDILRNYAVERTRDQRVLAFVVLSGFGAMGRRVAARRLEDCEVLLDVAGGDPDVEVRKAAIDRLEELGQEVDAEELLRRPTRKDSASSAAEARERAGDASLDLDAEALKRKSIAERTSNPETLANLALNDPHHLVRLTAMRRLEDPEALRQIMEQDEDENVRGFAESRLRALGHNPHKRPGSKPVQEHEDAPAPASSPPTSSPGQLAALGFLDRMVSRVMRAVVQSRQKESKRSNPVANAFGRIMGAIFRSVNIRIPVPQLGEGKGDFSLDDLAKVRATFKRVFLTVSVTLGFTIIVAVAYIHYRDGQGETYFLEGQKLLQQGKPQAALWFARAVQEDPSSWAYRSAAAQALLGNPSLEFLEKIPGDWQAISLRADGSLLGLSPEGEVHYLRGRNGAAVTARFVCWDPVGTGILYVGTDNGVYFEQAGETRLASGPNDPLARVWRTSDSLLAATARALYRPAEGKLKVYLETSGPVVDVNATHTRAVSLEGKSVRVWDLSEKKSAGVLPMEPGREASLASVAPDGRRVLSIDNAGQATLWEASAGWTSLPLDEKAALGLFTPDGSLLLTAGVTGLRTWEPSGARATRTFLGQETALEVALDPAGRYLALLYSSGVAYGPASILVPPREPVPDWDEPPELLELEAQLFARAQFTDDVAQTIPNDHFEFLRSRWEEEASAHARDCQSPDANLWNLYRRETSSSGASK